MSQNFLDHLRQPANQSLKPFLSLQNPGRTMRSTRRSENFQEQRYCTDVTQKIRAFDTLPQSQWPIALTAVAIGVSGWALFMTFATNQEKLSSSVYRSIVRALKADAQLREVLGEAIRPQPEWYLNGDPHIKGRVSSLIPSLTGYS